MEPIRVSIVFDATGQMQLRRGADELTRLSSQLAALSANAGSSGRVFRLLESDLNRFSTSLHRVTSAGLVLFNNAFERTYSLLSSFGRLSFYAALGQIAALSYGFRNLVREFFKINEQFAGLEITLQSVFGSLQTARKIREELTRITITSPLPFQDLANAVRAASVMPALTQKIAVQASTGTLSSANGFLKQYTQLLEQLTTFRPDKMTEDAVFALREALTGELRSLIRRFEFPSSLLVQSSGQPLEKLKRQPDLMFEAIKGALNKIISPDAIREIAKQPTKLFSNILEQALQIPLLRIGRAGEDQGKTSLYQKVLDQGYSLLLRFGEFANIDRGSFGPQSDRIGGKLSSIFDRGVSKLGSVIESVLSSLGVGQLDRPGSSTIERVYLLFERGIDLIEQKLPGLIEGIQEFGSRAIPIIQKFVGFLWTLTNTIVSLFNFNPLAGLAGLVAIRSLPTIVNNALGLIENGFIQTLTNIRLQALSGSIGPLARAGGLAGLGGGGAAAARGTLNSVIGNSPALYNQQVLASAGLGINAQGRLVHTTAGTKTGYFGQTYTARQNQFANFSQIPSNALFNQGQSFADALLRSGMVFDQVSGRVVYAPGSLAGAAGSAVPNNRLPRFNPNMLNQSATAIQALNGRQTMGSYYSGLRAAGQGRIISGLAAGTAGSVVGLGFGQGAAAAVAGGVAGLAAIVGPIIVAVAATGFFMAALDMASSYLQSKADAEQQKVRSALGVSDTAIRTRSGRLGAEISFGRNLDQFLSDAKTLGGLEPGSETVGSFGRVRVKLPTAFGSVLSASSIPGGLQTPEEARAAARARFESIRSPFSFLASQAPSSLKVLGASAFSEQEFDLPGLITLRTNIQNDLRALSDATSGDFFKEAGAKLELASSQFRDEAGNLTSVVINNREEAIAAIRELRSVFDTTTGQVDQFVTAVQNVYRTSSGKELVSFGLALEDATKAQFDRLTATVQALNTDAGFLARSPQFNDLREKMKSFEDSPDLRLIVEQSESIFSSFRDVFEPFFKVGQIFSKETGRVSQLRKLQEGLGALKDNGVLDTAIAGQVSEIDKALEFYGKTFGEKFTDGLGREQLRIRVDKLDSAGRVVLNAANGLPETVLVAWDDWARDVRVKLLSKTGDSVLKGLNARTTDALLQIPLNVVESVSLTLSQLFDGIEGSSRSATERVVSQAREGLGMFETLALELPDLFPNISGEIEKILASVGDLPAIEDQRTQLERDTVGFRRLDSVTSLFNRLKQTLEGIRDVVPVENVPKLDRAIEDAQVGVLKFTSKLSEAGNKLSELADQLNFDAMQNAFQTLISNKSFFDTPTEQGVTNRRIGLGQQFLARRFGINVGADAFDFTKIPTDEFAANTRRPFARESELLNFLRLISNQVGRTTETFERQAAIQRQEQGFVDPAIALGLSRSQSDLDEINVGIGELERTIILGTDRFEDSNRKESAALLQALIDQASNSRTSQSSRILGRLQGDLGKFGFPDFQLSDGFLGALNLDPRGNSLSTQIKQLTEFGKQYASLADMFDQRALDLSLIKGVDTEAVKSLESMALNFRKLADEAERTKEKITGRGGVFNSFADGFQEVTDEWFTTAGNWSQIGGEMARSVSGQLSDSLFEIAVHAKDAGEAFKAFGQSILETAAKLAINKTVESILGTVFKGVGAAFGSGSSGALTPGSAGTITGPAYGPGFATGGMVPGLPNRLDGYVARLSSGEYIIPADKVSYYGANVFESYRNGTMPRFASGGMVDSPMSHVPPTQTTRSGSSGVTINVPLTINTSGNGQQAPLDAADTEKRAEMFSKGLQALIQDYTIRQTRQGGFIKNFVRGGGR